MASGPHIAVVIPAYRVRSQLRGVIEKIPASVSTVIVVDDACPERSGDVAIEINSSRVVLVRHEKNQGVGGAVVSGYKEAIKRGADIAVKIDGDGQMDPALLPGFVRAIAAGKADYVKGNRFFQIRGLQKMPPVRLFGNSVLSLMSKIMSGYWQVMDPTNGYTAIHCSVLKILPLDRLSRRYFFESDMLYHLALVRGVIADLPMRAVYGDEKSSLKIWQVALEFPGKFLIRWIKRVFYNYFLRDFNLGTIQIVAGLGLTGGGLTFGAYHFLKSISTGVPATSGTVMIAALPLILGFQSLLGALQFDVLNVPVEPIQRVDEVH